MNFVALKSEIEKSEILIKSMLVMINQPISQEIRGQIVKLFEKIAIKIVN